MQTFETLYKRTATDAVQIWYQEVNGDSWRTVSGQIDGLKVTSEWHKCEPKNPGKKNATTGEEQAVKEVEANYTKRLKLGYFKNQSDIDGEIYFKPMLAKKYDDYVGKINFKNPVYVQPKLDGCVSGSMLVETENGTKTVEEVYDGDDQSILSYNHELDTVEFARITGKFKNASHVKNDSNRWLMIKLKSGKILKVTDNHRVFLPEINAYREAKLLKIGDVLLKTKQN